VSVPLESIRRCFEGVIPSPFATCSADGTPNVTYMSIVHYVDSERVALSHQFFNKTRANLGANPQAQVRVVDPQTMDEYALDLRFLHTATDGPIFDSMKANLDAVARQTGMDDVFRLRGIDVHRVVRCELVRPQEVATPTREVDPLGPLDELVRRLAAAADYDEATRVALQALDDLFGFRHSVLFAADEDAESLFAVASNGYPRSSAGAEIATGSGLIGIAAERRHVVCIPNLARGRVMGGAVLASSGESPVPDIPLPGLAGVQSAAAVPLVARGHLTGLLYLESEQPGSFGPRSERLLRVIAGLLATTLALLESDRVEVPAPERAVAPTGGDRLEVAYYQADDSIFVAGEYVIRGVPGRILWRLVNTYADERRTAFTNRELRLDERLGLPAGADNLEARLLVLRKRLAATDCGIGLERVGRGRLELRVAGKLALTEVPTSGPMRAAHAADKELGRDA
jgi:adenylate cyclase